MEERFRAYFETVRYAVWDDLISPHVWVAEDGRNGWLAVHIEARLTSTDADDSREREFESAWIATYEKINGSWLLTGIASSLVERD